MEGYLSPYKGAYEIPPNYPAIYLFGGIKDKLFVITYKRRKDGKALEAWMFDHKGKALGKMWLPFRFANAIDPYPGQFANGKFYQLVEHEEKEEWELHATTL